MSSLSHKKIRSKRLDVRPCNDRITNLPRDLIIKILSCLPTKDAVATSVLSTKWKGSWTSITNLDFDFGMDFYRFDWDSPFFRKGRGFINRVLLLHDKSCLQRFHLKGYKDYDDSLLNAWLVASVQCHVQVIDICIMLKHQGLLVSDIVRSSTLVVLKLSGNGTYVIKPTSSSLPCLKTLHVYGVLFSSEESITSLLSGCHVLEELKLCECVGGGVRIVKISADALKKLIIEYLPYNSLRHRRAHVNYLIVIDTPALECFSFNDFRFRAQVKVVRNMNHLINVDITYDRSYTVQFQELHSEGVTDFLKKISQVENLALYGESMMVISSRNPVFPKFSKLHYLKLDIAGHPEWILLAKLLENSPSLETLYLIQGAVKVKKIYLDNSSFHDVPSCFLFNLKKVEIEYFENSEGEMAVVEYILKNAKILENLTLHWMISTHDPTEDIAAFSKDIVALPRASATCKVAVVTQEI